MVTDWNKVHAEDRQERDNEISSMIRGEIAKLDVLRENTGYKEGSAMDTLYCGIEDGLRRALAFVDPDPHS